MSIPRIDYPKGTNNHDTALLNSSFNLPSTAFSRRSPATGCHSPSIAACVVVVVIVEPARSRCTRSTLSTTLSVVCTLRAVVLLVTCTAPSVSVSENSMWYLVRLSAGSTGRLPSELSSSVSRAPKRLPVGGMGQGLDGWWFGGLILEVEWIAVIYRCWGRS